VQASLLIAKQKFGRHPRLSTRSMAAPLHGTSMIVSAHNGLAVCMRQRNLQQTFALLNSSSHAFRLKAFSRFNSMRASNSSANSSVNLATSNLHAHNLQVLNSISLNLIPCHHSNKQTGTELNFFELVTMSPFQQTNIRFCVRLHYCKTNILLSYHDLYHLNSSYNARKKATLIFIRCLYVDYVST